MNLGKLYEYLGDLIAAGTDRQLPVTLPGCFDGDPPQELTSAHLIDGPHDADPAPKMSAFQSRSGAALLLSGIRFDYTSLEASHAVAWPLVDAPSPGSRYSGEARASGGDGCQCGALGPEHVPGLKLAIRELLAIGCDEESAAQYRLADLLNQASNR